MWDAGAKTQITPRFAELLESTASTAKYVHWDSTRGFHSLDAQGSKERPTRGAA